MLVKNFQKYIWVAGQNSLYDGCSMGPGWGQDEARCVYARELRDDKMKR